MVAAGSGLLLALEDGDADDERRGGGRCQADQDAGAALRHAAEGSSRPLRNAVAR